MKRQQFNRQESISKALGSGGAMTLALGVLVTVFGTVIGVLMIVTGAGLLKSRSKVWDM